MVDGGTGPLVGYRVLDFSRAIAGAYTTRLLADMGARIIKIEPPEAGDSLRYLNLDDPRIANAMEPTFSPMFIHCNAGKESVCVDFKKPESIELLKALAARVDVVVENFTPHVLPSYGLGYEHLKAIRPDLILCSITGFGQTGPLAEHVSNDAVGQAMSGMASLTVDDRGYPVEAGNGVGDSATSLTAAMAILAALLHRERTGEGQHIDVSIVDSLMALDGLGHAYTAATRGEYTVDPHPRTHFLFGPWGVFKGPNERYFGMLAPWPRLCEMMGRPELVEDPRFATAEAFLDHREEAHRLIEEYFQSYESDEALFDAMIEKRIPAGPVLDTIEVQTHPQLAAREMVRDVPYALKTIPTVATAPRFSATPISVGRAPYVGEHNDEVCRELLGMSEDQLRGLYESGAMLRDEAVRVLFES